MCCLEISVRYYFPRQINNIEVQFLTVMFLKICDSIKGHICTCDIVMQGGLSLSKSSVYIFRKSFPHRGALSVRPAFHLSASFPLVTLVPAMVQNII